MNKPVELNMIHPLNRLGSIAKIRVSEKAAKFLIIRIYINTSSRTFSPQN
jgi:hypothetical protein